MKRKGLWWLVALIIVGVGLTSRMDLQAQEAPKKTQKPAAAKKAPAVNSEEMMAEYLKYGTPGEAHQRLKPLEGSWNTTVKMWMGPGEPTESKGTSEKKWILDGRFIQENYQGEFMGKPFTGVGLTGYDNYKKKYIGIWTDSMSTSIWNGQGAGDASGKVIPLAGSFDDPVTGKKKSVRAVTKIVDGNKHIFEWYEPGPDGKEIRTMEITYTRK